MQLKANPGGWKFKQKLDKFDPFGVNKMDFARITWAGAEEGGKRQKVIG